MHTKHTSKALALLVAIAIALLGAVPAFALGGTTAAQTPRTADEAQLKWDYRLKETDDWYTNVSDPVLVGSEVFIAVGDQLLRLANGSLAGQAKLAGSIDYTCRPLALDSIIYIPLSGGRLQAINSATLQSVWVTNSLPEHSGMAHQAQTTLVADSGMLYFGPACADWEMSYYGMFLCVNAATGSVVWSHENTAAGYYWSGAALYNGVILIAGDDGVLTALRKTNGSVVDTLSLNAPVRTTIVVEGSNAFAVTKDGTLHKIALNTNGTFGAKTSLRFAAESTSTPAITGGNAYVGGMKADYSGILAVIDIANMTLEKTIAATAPVQSSPLISTAYTTPYVYYTANGEPGALYVYDGAAGAILYTPSAADQNYCMASAVAGSDGTLYYTNDSGKLFAVEKKTPAMRTWLDKLPEWLGFLRGWQPSLQNIVYFVFFGWIWDVIYP